MSFFTLVLRKVICYNCLSLHLHLEKWWIINVFFTLRKVVCYKCLALHCVFNYSWTHVHQDKWKAAAEEAILQWPTHHSAAAGDTGQQVSGSTGLESWDSWAHQSHCGMWSSDPLTSGFAETPLQWWWCHRHHCTLDLKRRVKVCILFYCLTARKPA